MSEAHFQSKVIQFLKKHGAYVIKTRPGMGTPTGCPDVVALCDEKWLAIECKASSVAPYRVGQQATLDYLGAGNQFVFTAYPENWEEIKEKLLRFFF